LEPFIEAANIGRKNNITVILNPGMLIIDQGLVNLKELLGKIDIFILSQIEFYTLLNIQEKIKDKTIVENANTLLELGIKVLIVTMGERGAFLLTDQESELIPSANVSQVIDTTGAGDAFSAGFIYEFVKNLSYAFEDLKQNVKIGNFVAGKCIQELGARNGIPTSDEVKQIN